MKKKKAAELFSRFEGGQLTSADRHLLEQDPDLQRQLDELKAVGGLIGLKRYVQVPEGAERRCLQDVRQCIAERSKETGSTGWLAGWRWAFTTAFVGMLALHAFTLRDFSGTPLSVDRADPLAGAAAFHESHVTHDQLLVGDTAPDRPVILVASNHTPRYGNEFNRSEVVSGYLKE